MRCYNDSDRLIERNIMGVHYEREAMSKLTVTSMNCLEAGFQYLYKTILSNGMNVKYPPNNIAIISNWFKPLLS